MSMVATLSGWLTLGIAGAVLMWLSIVLNNLSLGLGKWSHYWPPRPLDYCLILLVSLTGPYAFTVGLPLAIAASIGRAIRIHARDRRVLRLTYQGTATP